MKIILAGGSGHVGTLLDRHFAAQGHDVYVLTRKPSAPNHLRWDGKSLGDWTQELEGCDVLINLAGRSVNCRYTEANLTEMMDSRVDSTKVLGQAVMMCKVPPKLWLNSSTATIYAHRYEGANDEITGQIGGNEPGVPDYWGFSVRIAQRWEEAFFSFATPKTRKVALRSAMVMSVVPGSVFTVLAGLARNGLLGSFGDGKQMVSWIHEHDFVEAIDFLIAHEKIDGVVNICAPEPLPNKQFNAVMRSALKVRVGLPAPKLALEIGAALRKTDTELLLKSRNVVPRRLVNEGFEFRFPHWTVASKDLAGRLNR